MEQLDINYKKCYHRFSVKTAFPSISPNGERREAMATQVTSKTTTTLYDVVVALQQKTSHLPQDESDALVVGTIVEMLKQGRITYRGPNLLIY